MTKQNIIAMIKSEMVEDLKYNNIDKLSRSPYYVSHIIDRIGQIAFDADCELTHDLQNDILTAVFSN